MDNLFRPLKRVTALKMQTARETVTGILKVNLQFIVSGNMPSWKLDPMLCAEPLDDKFLCNHVMLWRSDQGIWILSCGHKVLLCKKRENIQRVAATWTKKCHADVRGQKRIGRLVQNYRKANSSYNNWLQPRHAKKKKKSSLICGSRVTTQGSISFIIEQKTEETIYTRLLKTDSYRLAKCFQVWLNYHLNGQVRV